jgi:RNA polymerase sigma factor (sigma-70 family)
MRQVLLDEVRRVRSAKRSAPVETLWFDPEAPEPSKLDIEAFDDALKRLFEIDEARARVVELRFYAGLTLEEIAENTGESLSTVKRRWRVARAWLLQSMEGG